MKPNQTNIIAFQPNILLPGRCITQKKRCKENPFAGPAAVSWIWNNRDIQDMVVKCFPFKSYTG